MDMCPSLIPEVHHLRQTLELLAKRADALDPDLLIVEGSQHAMTIDATSLTELQLRELVRELQDFINTCEWNLAEYGATEFEPAAAE